MIQKLKQNLKDQRGLTLIELLAVIVILGIIAAIAIPSIMGLIDNTKKDAHVANAQQMINSTKIAVTSDKSLLPVNSNVMIIPLSYLEAQGYIEDLKDPDGDLTSYVRKVLASANPTTTLQLATAAMPTDDSYVVITNTAGKLSYSVRLVSNASSGNRGIKTTDNKPVSEAALSRSNVRQ